ncbi:MAG: SemiSWEET family transporter [Bacteroidetes bacterium]|jgi:MtN3 and saliva related transmembrane protein|nr:SemiSWEET family transporter [Bacteroidota bacterium]
MGSNTWVDYLGLFAAFLSAITFLPQVIQAHKTKSVKDLNIFMLLIVFSSVVIWLIYGFVKELLPVIIANGVILVLSGILLYFKATFKK